MFIKIKDDVINTDKIEFFRIYVLNGKSWISIYWSDNNYLDFPMSEEEIKTLERVIQTKNINKLAGGK